jgi:hypothetical protein
VDLSLVGSGSTATRALRNTLEPAGSPTGSATSGTGLPSTTTCHASQAWRRRDHPLTSTREVLIKNREGTGITSTTPAPYPSPEAPCAPRLGARASRARRRPLPWSAEPKDASCASEWSCLTSFSFKSWSPARSSAAGSGAALASDQTPRRGRGLLLLARLPAGLAGRPRRHPFEAALHPLFISF